MCGDDAHSIHQRAEAKIVPILADTSPTNKQDTGKRYHKTEPVMANEIPLVGYAQSDWAKRRREARFARVTPTGPTASGVPRAAAKGGADSLQQDVVTAYDGRGPSILAATRVCHDAVLTSSAEAKGAKVAGFETAHVSTSKTLAPGEIPLRGGTLAVVQTNTRSVIPAAVSQGRGIKPKKSSVKPVYRVGDLRSHDSALVLSQEMLEVKSLAVVELLVQTMKENISDVEQQIKACATLGHYSAIGNENQLERAGQAHQQMYDFDIISPEMLRIQQSGAIAAVMNAITAHTANRRLILRACWALEQMTAPIDNQRQFRFQGGEGLLETLATIYKTDHDIQASILKLRAPARTGKTWLAAKCCFRIDGCVVM